MNSLKKSHSIKLQYQSIIVPRFEVDRMKTQGEIAPQNFRLIHIVIQKFRNSFNKNTACSLTVLKLQVHSMKTQGEIALRCLDIENRKKRERTKQNLI